MFGLKSCLQAPIVEKENILVDMKEQALLAGIENMMMEVLFLLVELILRIMKSQMKIITADCCSGNESVTKYFIVFYL